MSRPPITYQDLGRLLAETNTSGVGPGEWFDLNGFEEGVEEALIQAARKGFPELMVDGVAHGQGDDPVRMFGDICATFMLSGFAIGWECHRQYGGGEENTP